MFVALGSHIDEDANMDFGNVFWMGVAVGVIGIGAKVFAASRLVPPGEPALVRRASQCNHYDASVVSHK